ncbi:MAG: DUF2341 domain-containing protein [Bacteroidia bacterium]|nr:DUF2341 domain-containing protein [Bacteroidia bacterium]
MKYKLLLPVLLFSSIYAQSLAQCLPGWTYYQEVILDHSSGTDDLVDYQIGIDLNTSALVSANKLNSDASDLRVFDKNCNALHFYLDSLASSTSNKVWVKVPLLPAGTIDTIYFYYGNIWAYDISSGDSTFLFFDDFEDGIIDFNKWQTVGAYDTLIEDNGELEFRSTQWMGGSSPRWKYVKSTAIYDSLVNVEFSIYQTNSSCFGFVSSNNPTDRYLFRHWTGGTRDSLTAVTLVDTTSNGYVLFLDYPWVEFYRNTFQNMRFKLKINSGSNMEVHEVTNLSTNASNFDVKEFPSFNLDGFSLHFTAFSNTQGQLKTGMVRVRAAVNGAEASSSLGTEYMNITTSLSELEHQDLHLYPNPTKDHLKINILPELLDEFRVYDLSGKQRMYLTNLQGNVFEVSSLGEGIYFLELQTIDKKVLRKKFVVLD